MSFFEQMITAIYRFQSYPRLMLQRLGKVICYLLIFTVIMAIINALPYGIAYKNFGGIDGAIKKYVPDFSIENGKLSCNTVDFSDENMGVKILIDCNEDADSVNIEDYSYAVIADSDKVIVANDLKTDVIEFSQFKDETINKNILMRLFGNREIEIAVFLILTIIFIFSYGVNTLIGVVFITAFVIMINMLFIKGNIRYYEAFKLSVYVRTFPCILFTLINCLGFQGGGIIYAGVLITYIYLALKNVKKQEAIILAEL